MDRRRNVLFCSMLHTWGFLWLVGSGEWTGGCELVACFADCGCGGAKLGAIAGIRLRDLAGQFSPPGPAFGLGLAVRILSCVLTRALERA